MTIAYAVISCVEHTRTRKQLGTALGGARADLRNTAVGVALCAYVRRRDAMPAAPSNTHIHSWRRTSTAATRCLAWMEGEPSAVARQITPAALPRSLADHELARIARDWLKGRLSRGIWHWAIHSAHPRRSNDRRHRPISRRQG
jgi:hypothetical protein